jgi:hypothetical protein
VTERFCSLPLSFAMWSPASRRGTPSETNELLLSHADDKLNLIFRGHIERHSPLRNWHFLSWRWNEHPFIMNNGGGNLFIFEALPPALTSFIAAVTLFSEHLFLTPSMMTACKTRRSVNGTVWRI